MDRVERRATKSGRFMWRRPKDRETGGPPAKLTRGGSVRVSAPQKMTPVALNTSPSDRDLKEKVSQVLDSKSISVVDDKDGWVASNVSRTPHTQDLVFEPPPAWAQKAGEWHVQPISSPRYDIYEPEGPLWYINHHLRLPSMAYPRTSFPPTPYAQIRSQSSSSQLGRPPAKPRGTYSDEVDSLDGTDPYGNKWHHTSPYDLGRKPARPRSSAVGPGVGTYGGCIEGGEILEQLQTTTTSSSSSSTPSSTTLGGRLPSRSRNSSHIRLAPSPLSQSTSAHDLTPKQLSDPPVAAPINLIKLSDPEPEPEPEPEPDILVESPVALDAKPDTPIDPPESAGNTPIEFPKTDPEPTKLSKRESRKTSGSGGFFGMFGSKDESKEPKDTAPKRLRTTSALSNHNSAISISPPKLSRKPSRQQSNSAPTSPMTADASNSTFQSFASKPPTIKPSKTLISLQTEEKREKRTSMIGRLVKKMSTMRKPGAVTWGDDNDDPKRTERPSLSILPSRSSRDEGKGSSGSSLPSQALALASQSMDQLPIGALSDPQPHFRSASEDLPHHLSTPRIMSPLPLRPPSPPDSPPPEELRPPMKLTLMNPDLPSTPSPTNSHLPLLDNKRSSSQFADAGTSRPPSSSRPQTSAPDLKASSRDSHRLEKRASQPVPGRQPSLNKVDHIRSSSSSPTKRNSKSGHRERRSHDVPRDTNSSKPDSNVPRPPSSSSKRPESTAATVGSTLPTMLSKDRRVAPESTMSPYHPTYPGPSLSTSLPVDTPRRGTGSSSSVQSVSRTVPSGIQAPSSVTSAVPPPTNVTSPKTLPGTPGSRRKPPSLEVISAGGKEWEVVDAVAAAAAEAPSRHRTRSSRDGHPAVVRQRSSQDRDSRRTATESFAGPSSSSRKAESPKKDKTKEREKEKEKEKGKDPANPHPLKAALENAWTGPIASRMRPGHRLRSLSVDSSTTTGRPPPTPPPKSFIQQHPPTNTPTDRRHARSSSASSTSRPSLPRTSSSDPPILRSHSRSRKNSAQGRDVSNLTISNPVRLQKPTPPTPKPTPRPELMQLERRRSSEKHIRRRATSTSPEPTRLEKQQPSLARDAWEREKLHMIPPADVLALAMPVNIHLQRPQQQLRSSRDGSRAYPPTNPATASGMGSSHTSFSLQGPLDPRQNGNRIGNSYNQIPSPPQYYHQHSNGSGHRFGYEPAAPPMSPPQIDHHYSNGLHNSYGHLSPGYGHGLDNGMNGQPHYDPSGYPYTYTPSTSLPNLNPYPNNYIQFSTRAPYPIAPYLYGQQPQSPP